MQFPSLSGNTTALHNIQASLQDIFQAIGGVSGAYPIPCVAAEL
jgi:hypothetical protein